MIKSTRNQRSYTEDILHAAGRDTTEYPQYVRVWWWNHTDPRKSQTNQNRYSIYQEVHKNSCLRMPSSGTIKKSYTDTIEQIDVVSVLYPKAGSNSVTWSRTNGNAQIACRQSPTIFGQFRA